MTLKEELQKLKEKDLGMTKLIQLKHIKIITILYLIRDYGFLHQILLMSQ